MGITERRRTSDILTGEGEWGRVSIKDMYIYVKELCKIQD